MFFDQDIDEDDFNNLNRVVGVNNNDRNPTYFLIYGSSRIVKVRMSIEGQDGLRVESRTLNLQNETVQDLLSFSGNEIALSYKK